VDKQLARNLISAGVHFGHGSSRWNPKMKPYIFGTRSKIHIIDVKETLKGLLIAKKLLADVVSSGKDVVFVGTKRQAQKPVEDAAAQCGMHYISQRWLGGMLTNFRTVRSRLQRLEQLEAMQTSGKLDAESKKQASRLKREMRKIKTNLEGVRKMSRLPGVVVVVDTKKENIALREAKKLGIATVGIIDSDSNPDAVDVAIPANDDSIKAIEILLGELAEAVAVGKTMFKSAPEQEQTTRRRSKRRVLASAEQDTLSVTQQQETVKPETGDKAKKESDSAPAAETAAADTAVQDIAQPPAGQNTDDTPADNDEKPQQKLVEK